MQLCLTSTRAEGSPTHGASIKLALLSFQSALAMYHACWKSEPALVGLCLLHGGLDGRQSTCRVCGSPFCGGLGWCAQAVTLPFRIMVLCDINLVCMAGTQTRLSYTILLVASSAPGHVWSASGARPLLGSCTLQQLSAGATLISRLALVTCAHRMYANTAARLAPLHC